MALWRLAGPAGARLATGAVASGPQRWLPAGLSVGALLAAGDLATAAGAAEEAVDEPEGLLAPVDSQPVWAAGVTYQRSREARMAESEVPDSYERVYDAPRPELFLKAMPGAARGPGAPVAVRADSGWDVPEPELGVVADSRGQIVAYVVGNDVSSRRIEGENPLYLPQAKIYRGSCGLGPCLVPVAEAPPPGDMEISLEVTRDGRGVYTDRVRVADMRRGLQELVDWLYRAQDFPEGVVLLTGTAIVPPQDFTLQSGDEVAISITGLGELRNGVESVGEPVAGAGAVGA